MTVGETRENAEGAASEIDRGLRQLSAATDSQRAMAELAHEGEWIANQLKIPLDLALGYLATAGEVAQRIAATSGEINTLLGQLPTSEVANIHTANEDAGGVANRVLELVEAAHVPLAHQGEAAAELRSALQPLSDAPPVKGTWAKLHHAYSQIKGVARRL